LKTKDKTKLDWKKTANKLKEALEHHIQEEESKIFSLAQNILTNQEAEQVGDAFLKLKGEIKGEGVLKSSLDIAINLLPPRLTNKVRDLNLNNLNVNK
jgi:5-formyltetrahydrofolate cyclo-ligase